MAIPANNSSENSSTTGNSDKDQKKSANSMNVDKFVVGLLDDLKANKLELPTLPHVAVKINRVVEDSSSSAKDVAKVVTTDPSLSARLLQVANSPLVRGDKKIDSIQFALTRMGSNMVRSVVTGFLVKQLFRTENKTLQNHLTAIWDHSAHVAAISHVLATRFTSLNADDVMLAGLLHDIGKLPIVAKARHMPALSDNEQIFKKVMEKLHQPLGKAILKTWNFSDEIINAASQHEKIFRDSEKLDFTDVVLVANLHSHIGKSRNTDVNWNEIPAMKKMHLEAETSIEVLEEAQEDIMEIRNLFTS